MPNFEHNQKLPLTINYETDPLLFQSFIQMFGIWNFACDGIFSLSMGTPATISAAFGAMPVDTMIAFTEPLGATAQMLFKTGYTESDITMLHELGHALGLDHSLVPHSIMNPEPTATKTEPTLVQDDIDGVRQLYSLAPKTFDVSVAVRGRTAMCRPLFGNHPKLIRIRLMKGVNEIDVSAFGISVYKTVTAK